MLNKIAPEAAGLDSRHIKTYIERLNKRQMHMHSVLMMRGNDIIYEGYWAPFDKDFCHRMYSETKSYVSVAIGLLEEDGLLNLDDRIASFFEDKFDHELNEFLGELTVREMLCMTTCRSGNNWFSFDEPDRTKLYFRRTQEGLHPSGTVWEYDSSGSQVLSALVERLAQKRP